MRMANKSPKRTASCFEVEHILYAAGALHMSLHLFAGSIRLFRHTDNGFCILIVNEIELRGVKREFVLVVLISLHKLEITN